MALRVAPSNGPNKIIGAGPTDKADNTSGKPYAQTSTTGTNRAYGFYLRLLSRAYEAKRSTISGNKFRASASTTSVGEKVVVSTSAW